LRTATHRPTVTSSATLSMMAATSFATNTRRTGARYKFQNRNSWPLLAVVLAAWPNRLVPKFQKHSPNLICSYILREWNIYMLMPFPNELCYLSGFDHVPSWNYQIGNLVKILYTVLGYTCMETFMAIPTTLPRVI
jgi:hypothetical protein